MMLLSRLAWLCLALVLACTSASAQYLSEIFADSVVSTNWEIFGGSSTEDAVGNTYQVFMFPSGSTVTVGEITLVNQGGFDTALVKIDPLGNIDWVRALQSPGNEEFFQVTTDPAGNVYVVGFTDTAQAGITINYSWDGILVKYDTNGNLQWITNKFSAQYFGSQQDSIMTVLYANNMLYFVQVSTALHVQVFQTDLNGNVQWTYTLPLVNAYYFTAFQLAVDPLRNQIYVAGQFYGQWSSSISNGKTVTGFSSQSWDGFLFAISTSGFPQWVIPQATPNNDYSQSVVLDSAGYVYVGSCIASSIDGQTYSSGGCNPLVIKYDWQGNRQWTRIYSQFPNMLTASLVMDNTGAFYARVTDGNSQNIIKSDTNGNVIWTQSLPGATGTTRDCGWNLPSGWCRGGSNAYLDGTAAFTLSGVYSGNFFGWASNQWVPYVSKWQLNVTCTSCTQFDTVLAELQTLLNVVVN